MKAIKITYWISTGIISAMMLLSAFMYITNPQMKAAFVHLGFPDFFRIELAIAKILGTITIILPFIPRSLKIMAYSGFFITFISAVIAHISVSDAPNAPIVAIIILFVSYYCFEKLNKEVAKN